MATWHPLPEYSELNSQTGSHNADCIIMNIVKFCEVFYPVKMECSASFLQFILAVFLKSSVELTLTPLTPITYLGGTINFTCHKSDPSVKIAWTAKLVQNHYFVANNESTTVLSVTFNSSNVSFNNSYVNCIGYPANNPADLYCSNSVQIKLQGL